MKTDDPNQKGVNPLVSGAVGAVVGAGAMAAATVLSKKRKSEKVVNFAKDVRDKGKEFTKKVMDMKDSIRESASDMKDAVKDATSDAKKAVTKVKKSVS